MPVLVIVKVSVEVAPAAIVVGANALSRVGASVFTTRQTLPAVTVALVVVTLAERLVNAAGGPTQLAFTAVARLVRPATVTVQLAVPAVIAMPVRPERTRVPTLYAAAAGPEQPAE